MVKIIAIVIVSAFSLCSLSACGTQDKKQSPSSKEIVIKQLSPKVKKKVSDNSKNESVQTAPSLSSSNSDKTTSSSTDLKSVQEQQNKDLVTKFFTDYLVFDTSKTPAYQRASKLLTLSNENVVNYLMPNVLGNGNSVSESMNYTQSFVKPMILGSSNKSQYQYDVTVEYKTIIGNNSNQTKELYSLTVEKGKIIVIRKDKTWLWDVESKVYQ
jgi:hypothetical protein